jgi:hypothetical protein
MRALEGPEEEPGNLIEPGDDASNLSARGGGTTRLRGAGT